MNRSTRQHGNQLIITLCLTADAAQTLIRRNHSLHSTQLPIDFVFCSISPTTASHIFNHKVAGLQLADSPAPANNPPLPALPVAAPAAPAGVPHDSNVRLAQQYINANAFQSPVILQQPQQQQQQPPPQPPPPADLVYPQTQQYRPLQQVAPPAQWRNTVDQTPAVVVAPPWPGQQQPPLAVAQPQQPPLQAFPPSEQQQPASVISTVLSDPAAAIDPADDSSAGSADSDSDDDFDDGAAAPQPPPTAPPTAAPPPKLSHKKSHKHHKKPAAALSADGLSAVPATAPPPAPAAISGHHTATAVHSEQLRRLKNDLDMEFADHDGAAERPGGAVLSLTLGIIVTVALAMLVGCRANVVRRRVRGGRPGKAGAGGYAHEADFLVNGMYL